MGKSSSVKDLYDPQGASRRKVFGDSLEFNDVGELFDPNRKIQRQVREQDPAMQTASTFEAVADPKAGLPAPAPDLTDAALAESRKTQALRATAGKGRKSTFLTGPVGDTSVKPLAKKTLLGGY